MSDQQQPPPSSTRRPSGEHVGNRVHLMHGYVLRLLIRATRLEFASSFVRYRLMKAVTAGQVGLTRWLNGQPAPVCATLERGEERKGLASNGSTLPAYSRSERADMLCSSVTRGSRAARPRLRSVRGRGRGNGDSARLCLVRSVECVDPRMEWCGDQRERARAR